MSIQKLIDKYTNLQKKNYETIFIGQVINDLRNIQRLPTKKQIKEFEEEQRRLTHDIQRSKASP